MFVITKEWFDSNRDFVSGLNRAQADAVGVPYPLKKGWKIEVLGKIITLGQKENFEKLKGCVYSVRKKRIKSSRAIKSLESEKEVLELQLEIARMRLELKKLNKKAK